ncbi:hypothetical protein B484DRAFT_455308 [Ochromonadaceae sp. CCMP2298]|nr:hypothetical protein B484DRAFT_455308 [Ochromonadaceae sp. CCMP2298]
MADIELIFPNKKKVKAAPGTPLKDACKKAGFVPSYGCSEGKCGSCEMVMSNGKKIRPCTAKIPALPSPITFTV